MSTPTEPFGTRLRRLREKAGYSSQESLAMAGGWKGNQFISNLENRPGPPSLKTLQRLGKLLGCSVGELQGQIDDDVTSRVSEPVHTPRAGAGETPGSEEGSGLKDDPFGTIRYRWSKLSSADQDLVLDQIDDLIKSFIQGDVIGPHAAQRKRRK